MRRTQPPGLTLAQLPRIGVVLVSHNHCDPLDAPSGGSLNRQVGGPPLFIVPPGLKAWLAERGITNRRASARATPRAGHGTR